MKKPIVLTGIAVLIAAGITIAQAAEKHLFYVHGCCLNKVGTSDYESIVKSLRQTGYKVTFDVRMDDSLDEVKAYAARIADQVKDLIAKGTPPEDITVSGYSLGSATSLYASIAIANPKVNIVLLAGCPGPGARSFDIDYTKVQGRVLSIVDSRDDRFGSCKGKLSDNLPVKEIVFDSGEGHKMFRLSQEKYTRLWMDPMNAWSGIK